VNEQGYYGRMLVCNRKSLDPP